MARPVGKERLGAGPPAAASPTPLTNDAVHGRSPYGGMYMCEELIELIELNRRQIGQLEELIELNRRQIGQLEELIGRKEAEEERKAQDEDDA